MLIVEIQAQENGAHRNQKSDKITVLPDGWAIVPGSIAIPETFPFVNIEVHDKTVTSMTAGVMPEAHPEPQMPPTLEERTTALEEAMLAIMEAQNNV